MNAESAPANTVGNTYVPQYINYQLEEDQLKTQLTRRDTQMAIALNFKTNGIFETTETQNGEQWFGPPGDQRKKRFAFRMVFSFGAIAPGATLVIAHGLTGVTMFTSIKGTAITANDKRPIPYASATLVTNQIEINVASTQINVINGATAPAITSGTVVLEYLKQ